MTSTELVHRAPTQAPVRMTLDEKIRYAEQLSHAGLLPSQYRRQPANVLFALEYADALGVLPIHAITSIHVINGKPSASADLIASLIRKAGHRLRVTGDSRSARAELTRADDPDFTFVAEWDEAKATAAGLWGEGNWKTYPASMLKARCITEVGRAGASDSLFGVIYTPEELGAQVDADGNVVSAPSERLPANQGGQPVQGTVEDRPAAPAVPADPAAADGSGRDCATWRTAVEECTTLDECRAVWRSAGANDETRTATLDRDCGDGETPRKLLLARMTVLKAEEDARAADAADEAAREAAHGPMPDADPDGDQVARDSADDGDVVDAVIVPDPDPFESRKNSAPRRGHIAALIELLGGNEETMAAACEQEFGLVPSDVSTARLREWQMKISKANGQ